MFMKKSQDMMLDFLLCCLMAGVVGAAPNPAAPALDPAQLGAIPQRLQQFVADGAIAGAVSLVSRDIVLDEFILCTKSAGFTFSIQ